MSYIKTDILPLKQLVFLGDSKKALKSFPAAAQRKFGYELLKVQAGDQPSDSKPMPSVGSGVEEIRNMGRVRNISRDLPGAKAAGRVRSARLSKEVAGNKSTRSRTGAKASFRPLVTSGRKGEPDYEEFESVWDALGFSPQEAANLETRSLLMIQIERIIKKSRWTQATAAKHCGVSQPRVNDLLRGRIEKFSIDALVNMAACLGQKVHIQLKAA
jgi:predicted XRE-type DNA-binding protein/phage-related protein